MGGHFDLEEKSSRIAEIKLQLSDEANWSKIDYISKLNIEQAALEKSIKEYGDIKKEIDDYLELLSIDESIAEEISENLPNIEEKYDNLVITSLLDGEYDASDCYLEIHPGAGGTEACDWASMLYRMYLMFCDKNNYKYKIIDEQKGEEAGIKSVTMQISGYYPYGYFKGETGVHRLVRISPFDSNARRHTSFASVSVIPVIKNEISIDIKETDLKIDVYHSSGAGGQSVNTSNSAVRITHLPTKTVVTCQIERSQQQNKDIAMQMLKSKLYAIEKAKNDQKLNDLKGEIIDINFGSQIRNYVLEPYKLVKDLRTNYETSNTEKVLNGDILPLMESLLKSKKKNK